MIDPYYTDDLCTIYNADCLDVLPQIERVDHVITDPPYEAQAHTNSMRRSTARDGSFARDALTFDPIDEKTRVEVALEIGRIVGRWSITFCQIEASTKWIAEFENAKLKYKRTCIFVKPNGHPQFTGDRPGMGYETFVCMHANGAFKWNGGGKHGVYTFNVEANAFDHQTVKPLKLMKQLIVDFTDAGETVLDPFMGTGTTLRACKDLGRKCIGIERDKKYCDIAVRRLQQETLRFEEVRA